MNQRVFLDVLDHLVSLFGGRGRGGNWNFFFSDSGFRDFSRVVRGYQGL